MADTLTPLELPADLDLHSAAPWDRPSITTPVTDLTHLVMAAHRRGIIAESIAIGPVGYALFRKALNTTYRTAGDWAEIVSRLIQERDGVPLGECHLLAEGRIVGRLHYL